MLIARRAMHRGGFLSGTAEDELFYRKLRDLEKAVKAFTPITSSATERRVHAQMASVIDYGKKVLTGVKAQVPKNLNGEHIRWYNDRTYSLSGKAGTKNDVTLMKERERVLNNIALNKVLLGVQEPVEKAAPPPLLPGEPEAPGYRPPAAEPAPGIGIDSKTLTIGALILGAVMFGPKLLKGLKL